MTVFKRWSDRRRIRRLARCWQEFRVTLEPWFKRDEPAPEGVERAFLAVKSRVAQRLPVLGEVHGRRSLEQEAVAAMRDMIELMNRVSSLADVPGVKPAEREAMMREWHVLYIFLHKLEGTLTGSTIDGVVLACPAPPEVERGLLRRPRPGGPRLLDFVVRAIVVAALLVLVARFLDIDGDDIRSWIAGGAPSREVAATIGDTGSEGAALVRGPTGETEEPAPAAPLLSHTFRMPRLVQPVVMRYGTAGISVLCGALLVGTLILFRRRSR